MDLHVCVLSVHKHFCTFLPEHVFCCCCCLLCKCMCTIAILYICAETVNSAYVWLLYVHACVCLCLVLQGQFRSLNPFYTAPYWKTFHQISIYMCQINIHLQSHPASLPWCSVNTKKNQISIKRIQCIQVSNVCNVYHIKQSVSISEEYFPHATCLADWQAMCVSGCLTVYLRFV